MSKEEQTTPELYIAEGLEDSEEGYYICDGGDYVCYDPGQPAEINLDGVFTVEELRDYLKMMDEHTKALVCKYEKQYKEFATFSKVEHGRLPEDDTVQYALFTWHF